jgi:hypothetical protein
MPPPNKMHRQQELAKTAVFGRHCSPKSCFIILSQ